jgi:excisionase family DNA binding protein
LKVGINLENWQTTKEISELLKVSEETVRRWIRGGELTASLDGKSYVVKEEDLKKFIQEKAKTSGTSISKMITGTGVGIGLAAAFSPLLGATIAALVNKGLKKSEGANRESKSINQSVSEILAPTIKLEDIEDYIQALERKRKKTELEYQMKLLEIDDEIANYKKIKEQLENGGTQDETR